MCGRYRRRSDQQLKAHASYSLKSCAQVLVDREGPHLRSAES